MTRTSRQDAKTPKRQVAKTPRRKDRQGLDDVVRAATVVRRVNGYERVATEWHGIYTENHPTAVIPRGAKRSRGIHPTSRATRNTEQSVCPRTGLVRDCPPMTRTSRQDAKTPKRQVAKTPGRKDRQRLGDVVRAATVVRRVNGYERVAAEWHGIDTEKHPTAVIPRGAKRSRGIHPADALHGTLTGVCGPERAWFVIVHR
jgi:SLT domain-containing protein